MNVLSLVLSLAALVFSAGAVWYTRSQAVAMHRLVELEAGRRAEELEDREAAGHANLRLWCDSEFLAAGVDGQPVCSSSLLRVRNDGPAEAREVWVEVVAVVDSDEVPRLVGARQPRDLPDGEEVAYALDADVDVGIECGLRWQDESGSHSIRVEAPRGGVEQGAPWPEHGCDPFARVEVPRSDGHLA